MLIEREDFREEAPRKFFRLKNGGAVRLRAGYIVDCHDVVKDDDGNVTEILCTYDPETKSGADKSGRKVKGTIHWVSADHATEFEVRLYDRLFTCENPASPEEGKTFLDYLNPDSLKVVTGFGEPALAEHEIGDRVQFERLWLLCGRQRQLPRMASESSTESSHCVIRGAKWKPKGKRTADWFGENGVCSTHWFTVDAALNMGFDLARFVTLPGSWEGS